MYNADRKEKFMLETDLARGEVDRAIGAKRLFKRIGKYEEKYNQDFCGWNSEWINAVIPEINKGRSVNEHLGPKLDLLVQYSKWCLKKEFPDARGGIFGLKLPVLDEIRNSICVNRLQLEHAMDAVLDREEENTADNMHRAVIWLTYMGMNDMRDILSLKRRDVDLNNMVVKVRSDDKAIKEYPIISEAVPSLRNMKTLTSFKHKHGERYTTILPRVKSDFLFSGAKTVYTPDRAVMYRNILSSKLNGKECHSFLALRHVYQAGRFHYMFEQEQAYDFLDYRWELEQSPVFAELGLPEEIVSEYRERIDKEDAAQFFRRIHEGWGAQEFQLKQKEASSNVENRTRGIREKYLLWKIAYNL